MSVLRDYAAAVSQPTLPFASTSARYDEVVDADGTLRPAWQALASLALGLTRDELDRVDGEISRFLADDGVSYARAGSELQPWQLDPMPFVMDAAGWARLEVGLAQRAELLNALLADLYGPQTVLRERIVPAAVVLGHAGFVRAMARGQEGGAPPDLLLSAVDLGRDADGEWHVLGDRVQAPSGLGYAAENRRVISQVLPDLLDEGALHRMDPYFAALRAALIAAAPDGAETPRIVVLSPGPLSETAFDQAFLASALGFPLVQGSDLVVRGGAVWMKPAGWPGKAPVERVDVILRRVDAEWCDPLELRAGSRLGVAGLAEAVRRGRVRVVNGLGAGVLENPALLPYLPAVCERLLGEQLRLPSVPAWWLGDPACRDEVLPRLLAGDGAVGLRHIDDPRTRLDPADPDVRARLDREPHRYAAVAQLPLSQAPVWDARPQASATGTAPAGSAAAALPVTLRAFAIRFGSTYRPLVGGLATVRAQPGATPRTKDVWVLKADETDPDQGIADVAALPTTRSDPTLAPRALADLFWTGRYAERAEDLLRLVIATQAALDQPGAHSAARAAESVRVLLTALHALAGTRSPDPEAEFRSLLLDVSRPGSAAHSIARLRDAMEGVRDQLSGDTWRVFSNIDRAVRALRSAPHPHRTAESAGRMLASMLSLYGVTANMIRDPGWHMMEAGRYLERGLQLTTLLSSALTAGRGPRTEREVLESLLLSAESVVTHRRRYRGAMRAADVAELLLLDRGNPRSLAYSLATLREHLGAMPASTGSSRAERLLDELETELGSIDVLEVTAVTDGRRAVLTDALAGVTAQLEQLSDAIGHLHFEAGPPAVSLSELSLIELTGARA
ncbi:circularly permuted type 2 ATP-grasp protein [Microbacterium sp. EYE_5]|uniref:circularly permuted type 2 ATP-grasp protein n=1 Tax=unclassified Microbacterium TaxID=2609290 RepID=UPI002005D079|nr:MULTISPECIES: circularly permuted type 2 ATP-grasp protein [unclassified Microbacterium]MCK6079809.1 circularly permuted type 2 ATP-grasp protein [Microbacterium sp. EYE_382]MCK6085080.1 circularly permuted type 2 ATP-grasp protein [Microbacterium sp. EYE_384]MCK6122694.1 circularly permuted type 2 ATP-grasp protein [Microbacterium sp. EYE_80]MCK6125843.1 circularly permuted type 2 ATP-grasp protein [Microbacterium sp. EYE_79]MCK6140764.1 circularly permuted type 2 ATP-grasp protein [Microb